MSLLKNCKNLHRRLRLTVLCLNSFKYTNGFPIDFSKTRIQKLLVRCSPVVTMSPGAPLVLSVKISPRAGLTAPQRATAPSPGCAYQRNFRGDIFVCLRTSEKKFARRELAGNFIATIVKHQSAELSRVRAPIFARPFIFSLARSRDVLRSSLIFYVQWNLLNSVVVRRRRALKANLLYDIILT